MKPTVEQKKFIIIKLHGVLRFKEVFDELYDHILSALEATPNDAPFFDAVQDIIENELGGAKGIRTLEVSYIHLAIKEFIKNYFKCAFKCLASLPLLLIIISTIIFGILIKQQWFIENIAKGAFAWGMLLGPFLMHIINYMVKRNKTGVKLTPLVGHLKSDRQGFFSALVGFFPYFLWAIPNLIYLKTNHAGLPVGAVILLFFMTALHFMTCYKLYTKPKDFEYTT